MTASEIRLRGIEAPGNTHVGDRASENIGILCGIGLEIAAQLAELNQRMEVYFPLAGIKQPPAMFGGTQPKKKRGRTTHNRRG